MFERTILLNDQLRDNRWFLTVFGVLMAMLGGWLIGNFGVMGAVMTVGAPVALILVTCILMEPKIGLLVYIHLSFMLGFTRFLLTEAPMGLAMDSVLMLTLLSVFLNAKRMNWRRLRHPVYFALVFWLLYTILELLNPEAPYKPAWFYHARAFSLNWFYMGTIMLVMPITREDIRLLIKTWLIWSFFAALWGFKQQYIGLVEAERMWLAAGNAKTHVLWGQLRSFSFYSDASQFGAEMASATLFCSFRLFEDKGVLKKIGYSILILIFFWAYAISGTRSAFFVLVAGYPSYLFLRRDPVLIIRGIFVAIPILVILLFTHIGDSVYQIYRIRTALQPNADASFLVRLENQQKLKAYLRSLPFGAGIGTSADTGARFSPNHFAAQIPPDSWYVEIWIETGVVGLTLYLLMLATIIGYGVYKVWQIKDPWLFRLMIALLANFIGITLMCYSNPTLSQFPTCTMLYIASILFTTGERWDTKPESQSVMA
ncbi:O-antigen ligase family protein [Spirosoma agri]|uniref:O-antigen ligase family protein n=1 Tax=Spirosoma agri TaxID=1987381 RepID=A0A6M0ISB9_9BACT|nr:O-antigen ligase family protein [Spirosoma agri]NEU70465.1 O-antigen ligase family protein [Spirosoma agri]